MEKEDIQILRLMGEIEKNGNFTQRELSKRLNISVGLVNTFIKRLINKGYFKVKTMPRNRVKYLLTPEGIIKKSRLTVEYLQYSLNFYKEIKKLLLDKYREMEEADNKRILFYGAGEVAELAYLYLKMTTLRLSGIVDEEMEGKRFFEFRIKSPDRINRIKWDSILITRLDRVKQDTERLLNMGISLDRIKTL